MISSFQVTSSQSKTTIAKTPPAQTTTTEGTQTLTQTQQQQQVQGEQKQRLQPDNSDAKKDKNNQQNKHDWKGNDNVNENNINIQVPNFIRLFAIRRIIDKYIKNNKDKNKDKTKEEIIKELANVFKNDKKIESMAINIVTRLVNDGIKKYMNKWYDEEKQANIIEDIFHKIILKKCKQEYNEMIKYGTNNDKTNDNYCKNLLFDSIDLMNQIFQYLEWGKKFDKDLYSCSLVNSHWLYHSWNVNSVYHIDFSKLVEDNIDNNKKWTRIWQRLYNVKSITIGVYPTDSKMVATVNKLSMFRKVEKVDVMAGGNDVDQLISLVISIMSSCKDSIKDCRTQIVSFGSHSRSSVASLRLPKAQYVEIGDLCFYRQWTNECTQLKLFSLDNINKDWCKFVIENCDCSNITSLILHRVIFDNNSINEVILKQLALKFYNLKTLKIEIYYKVDDNVLLFWQLLKPIISGNKTKVKLKVDYLRHDQTIVLNPRIDEKDLRIDKLIIGYLDDPIKLIQERDNRGLKHLAFEDSIPDTKRKKLLNELKCKSITTLELKEDNIDFVNELLEWKMIVEKQIFVIIDVYVYQRNYDSDCDKISCLFKQLCENVYQLCVKQIAFDIKITFENVKDSKVFDSYLSQYSSYFENSQFLSKYNKPKCNNSNLCLPRDKPYTYFYTHDSQKEEKYFVFSATNVQMK